MTTGLFFGNGGILGASIISSIMGFPLLFPQWRSLLRSTVLFIAVIPLAVILRIGAESFFNALNVWSHGDRVLLWAVIVMLLIPVYYLGFVDQWLWGNPPKNQVKWVPCLKSLGEGLFSWIVICFSVLVVAIPVVIADPTSRGGDLTDEAVGMMTFFWWLLMAYCYHWRWLLVRWWQRIGKKKPQT